MFLGITNKEATTAAEQRQAAKQPSSQVTVRAVSTGARVRKVKS